MEHVRTVKYNVIIRASYSPQLQCTARAVVLLYVAAAEGNCNPVTQLQAVEHVILAANSRARDSCVKDASACGSEESRGLCSQGQSAA
jgi:hypothetical protein